MGQKEGEKDASERANSGPSKSPDLCFSSLTRESRARFFGHKSSFGQKNKKQAGVSGHGPGIRATRETAAPHALARLGRARPGDAPPRSSTSVRPTRSPRLLVAPRRASYNDPRIRKLARM